MSYLVGNQFYENHRIQFYQHLDLFFDQQWLTQALPNKKQKHYWAKKKETRQTKSNTTTGISSILTSIQFCGVWFLGLKPNQFFGISLFHYVKQFVIECFQMVGFCIIFRRFEINTKNAIKCIWHFELSDLFCFGLYFAL